MAPGMNELSRAKESHRTGTVGTIRGLLAQCWFISLTREMTSEVLGVSVTSHSRGMNERDRELAVAFRNGIKLSHGAGGTPRGPPA
jgi:hypothetical protein